MGGGGRGGVGEPTTEERVREERRVHSWMLEWKGKFVERVEIGRKREGRGG